MTNKEPNLVHNFLGSVAVMGNMHLDESRMSISGQYGDMGGERESWVSDDVQH